MRPEDSILSYRTPDAQVPPIPSQLGRYALGSASAAAGCILLIGVVAWARSAIVGDDANPLTSNILLACVGLPLFVLAQGLSVSALAFGIKALLQPRETRTAAIAGIVLAMVILGLFIVLLAGVLIVGAWGA